MRAAASAMFGARLGRPVSDERLVARVRAGDSQAFEEIYDRYSRPVHSFCRHLLGQPDDAEDAVQHTFLAAYRGIHRSDQPIDLKPWLFAIARNRCVSVLRARRHDPALAGPGSSALEPATEGLLAAVERRESLRDLLRDIGTLPEDQRSALILTQLGTLKHEEVARVLGVPTAKVRALVFQARNSLISTRLARETACHDIREQLATLSGGGLRRGNLRRHLVSCSGCRDYQLALKRQRAAIVALLPVVAQPLLRQKVLAEVAGGAGAGAAGAGVAAGMGGTAGGLAVNGFVLKIGLAATVAATSVGAAVITGGGHRAPDRSQPAPAAEVAKAGPTTASRSRSVPAVRRQQTRPRYQVINLGKPKHSSSKSKQRSREKAASSPRSEPADQQNTPSSSTPANNGTTPPGQAEQGGTPPGQTKKKSTPPGLAKQGGTPPGQTNKNGTPPGLAKQGGTPPGQAKKNTPAPAVTTPAPAPASPPGNGNGNSGSGNANGNGNGQANGNGNGNGNAGGNGNGKGH